MQIRKTYQTEKEYLRVYLVGSARGETKREDLDFMFSSYEIKA